MQYRPRPKQQRQHQQPASYPHHDGWAPLCNPTPKCLRESRGCGLHGTASVPPALGCFNQYGGEGPVNDLDDPDADAWSELSGPEPYPEPEEEWHGAPLPPDEYDCCNDTSASEPPPSCCDADEQPSDGESPPGTDVDTDDLQHDGQSTDDQHGPAQRTKAQHDECTELGGSSWQCLARWILSETSGMARPARSEPKPPPSRSAPMTMITRN